MKKIIWIYILLIFVSVSCKKSFLDLTDPTTKSADNFYANQQQAEQAVNGVYGQLQQVINSQYIFAEMASDNTTIQLDPSDRGQTDRVEAFEYWNVTATNVNIADLYNQTYNTIYNINFTIAKLDGANLPDAKKNQYLGELEFLRAYHYFNLVRYFGPVVLMTKALENSSDAFQSARSAEDVVYAQIIADLTDAAAKLPLKSEYGAVDVGRASKGAALSLLGKVYLTLKDYPKAESTLRQVLPLGYSLINSYAEVFNTANKNNAESVFEVQYQGGNNLGEWSNFTYVFAPRGSEGAVTGFPISRPQGWNIPTNNIIAAYEPNDARKGVSLKEGYTTAAGVFVPIPYVNKYNHAHTIEGRTDDNWPILRYSDVLLMLAEAINEQAGPANAYTYINQVRARAGLSPLTGLDQTAFKNAVHHERRIELAFENDRWFDLKRWLTNAELVSLLNAHGEAEKLNPTVSRQGVPFIATDYKFDGFEALYPIPDRQIFLSKNLIQNPGY